jgi:adenosine deaminase
MDLPVLPKIELHLHLDCSLSYEVVQKLDPDISREEYEQEFKAPENCRDLAEYISCSIKAINLMQDKESLQLVVEDLFAQLQADNVIYAELRFAPLEHTRKNLDAEDVVQVVAEATEQQVAQTGIEAGVILCTLRHYSEAQSMQTVKLVEQFQGRRVVGFDIAADEAGYPIDNHVSAFEYANEKNLNCTAHAGEACGADSVRETLNKLAPARIGHGVRSTEDPELVERLKEQDIHLEVCPTSNVQTNVFEAITDHNLNAIFDAGISKSINTDGRTISDVTLGREYESLLNIFNWDRQKLLKTNLEAIAHAFTSQEVKVSLRNHIMKAYAN